MLTFLSRAIRPQSRPLQCRSGMNISRNWRLMVVIGVVLVYAVVSPSLSPGSPLTYFSDTVQFLLFLSASLLMLGNAVSSRGQIRLFWALIAAGSFMSTANLGLWTLYEVVLRRPLPDPFIGDVILFLHIVPLMAAVALRPHRRPVQFRHYFIPLTFLMLLVWLLYAGALARSLKPSWEACPGKGERWSSVATRLAMLAILSLPVMGFWAWFGSNDSYRLRSLRLMVSLAAILALGVFVFIHQYLLDRELVKLLASSRRSLENLERLQTQIVQKEKLASLGQMVAGAAHEISQPLGAILRYSELLAAKDSLDSSQQKMLARIGQQAQRTQELVAGLLSFAQQSPGEKTLVDIGSLLGRALQMETLRMESKKIHVTTQIAPGLPPILGAANQLFQCCLEIMGNAMDALEESGGGTFSVKAWQAGTEILINFSDSGPGMREPKRVFDPFYTTKPIGKGAGLGLSVVYGIVQDHQGQINCENLPEGGAAYVLSLAIARQELMTEDLAEAADT